MIDLNKTIKRIPENIIEISEINIPDELLEKVILSEMVNDITEKFRKISEIENFKKEFDKSNAFYKFFYKGDLQDKAIDAVIFQNDMLKLQTQMIFFTILAAKSIKLQQNQIELQQNEIKEQNKKLAEQDQEIIKNTRINEINEEKIINMIGEMNAFIKMQGIRMEKLEHINNDQNEKFNESNKINKEETKNLLTKINFIELQLTNPFDKKLQDINIKQINDSKEIESHFSQEKEFKNSINKKVSFLIKINIIFSVLFVLIFIFGIIKLVN